MSPAIGAEPLGLAEAELAPLRAVMNGLVMPVFLASPSFREALEWARVGYSTRYLPMGYGLEPWAEYAARQARSRQAQREIRTRNGDWEKALPLLEPVLHAAALSWAATRGDPLASQDFAPLFQLLGLELTPHRRVALLRQLQGRGQLEETARKTWKVAEGWKLAIHGGELREQAAAFFGLNLIVPAIFQRFNQIEGSVLSLRHLRLPVSGRAEFHAHLGRLISEAVEENSRSASGAQDEPVIVGLYDATVAATAPLVEAQELSSGLRQVLLTAVAESLCRAGPWWVARDILCRRFVERVSESRGLGGVALYRHLKERYGILSANTVRAFGRGPTLEMVGDRPGFNRGQIQEIATHARWVASQLYPEAVAERVFRERVERRAQIAGLDVGVWQSALRRLEEEDVLRRIETSGGSIYAARRAEPQLVRSGHASLEANATVLLSAVAPMAEKLISVEPQGLCRARIWLLSRSALGRVRQAMLTAVDQLVKEVAQANLSTSPRQEEQRGLTPHDVLIVARVMPLI